MIPVGDELYLYYSGANIPHNIKGEDGKKKTVGGWPGKTIAGQHRAYAVGLAKLRRDGFVAMEPEAREGHLTTRALTFLGTRLHLNVASARGKVEVEVLDQNGTPIAGYGRRDCAPISTDSINWVVQWKEGRDLVHAAAEDAGATDSRHLKYMLRQPLRLKFYLENAKLYSFQVA